MSDDRNFDALSERFTRTIYGTPRGRLRLAALTRDFDDFDIAVKDKQVLDIGGGQGHFSFLLAEKGASISLCDISSEMIAQALGRFADSELALQAKVCALQDVEQTFPGTYDIILNHAVLEWLESPLDAIPALCAKVRPGGWLSIMFYNLHGHQWRQLMNGRLHEPMAANPVLKQTGNAPMHPLEPQDVMRAIKNEKLEIKRWRGIRCVRDHLPGKIRLRLSEEAIAESDLAFGLLDPYRQLGRYIHVLARRADGEIT